MKIELYIPGLLAVPARLADHVTLPVVPALEQWCGQARTHAVAPGRYGFFAERLPAPRPPLAALAWLGATDTEPARQIFFATPVHLQAGMDDLVLFAGPGLAVNGEEYAALADDIAAFFGDEPAVCHADGTLFLRSPHVLEVTTTPLHLVQGARVRRHLPGGADAGRLHAWMNELQMFLHGHALNRRRAAEGRPALNGLWLWGEGELPPVPSAGVVVHAQSAIMRGLGKRLGETRPPLASPGVLADDGEYIVEVNDCARALDADDAQAWEAAVRDVAARWLQPLLERARRDAGFEAVLYAGDGCARRVRREGMLSRAFGRLRRPAMEITREA